MVPSLKMRRLSCLLQSSLPPEMDEIAETFTSEIKWLALLKCRATGLSTSSFSYGTKMFGKPVRETPASLTVVKFMAFAAGYTVNDVRREHVKLCRMINLDLDPKMTVV